VTLAFAQPFGRHLGQLGLDHRFGVCQPLQVLGGQLQEPAAFGAADGGETGVAVAASPVTGGELAEVVAGAERADEPAVDGDVVAARQHAVENRSASHRRMTCWPAATSR
jgi:hypothetical protein